MKEILIFIGIIFCNGLCYYFGYRDAVIECTRIAKEVFEGKEQNEPDGDTEQD